MASVVIIYDPVLTAMSEPGGMVFKWAYQRSKKVERLAKLYAPKATGNMARQIKSSFEKVPNGVVMDVVSPAYYSVWVHEGTSDYFSRYSKMRIPADAGTHGPRAVYTHYRKGQRAKPFLSRALYEVMGAL